VQAEKNDFDASFKFFFSFFFFPSFPQTKPATLVGVRRRRYVEGPPRDELLR